MSALAMVKTDGRLDELADLANGKHREAFQAAMTMLYAGIAAGEALNEAKAAVGHGGWVAWCEANLEFTSTTACSYMLVARHKDELLARDDITTMQKAIRYLRARKLTSQTRIDEARIVEMRLSAAEHGISRAARLLGESFGTVRRYANGAEKTKIVKPQASGTQRRIGITDEMIESLAEWMCKRLWREERPVTDAVRDLAVEALRAALGPQA